MSEGYAVKNIALISATHQMSESLQTFPNSFNSRLQSLFDLLLLFLEACSVVVGLGLTQILQGDVSKKKNNTFVVPTKLLTETIDN